MNAYPHYFKALPPGCTHIDVYRVLRLFEVSDPALQHAVKKLLCAGARGAKDQGQDIAEAIATLQRWQQMREEEATPVTDFKLYTSPDVWTSQPAPSAAPDDAERAERAAYLARWKDAPENATHLAQDEDGVCAFYECKPALDSDRNWFGPVVGVVERNLLGSVRCESKPTKEARDGNLA